MPVRIRLARHGKKKFAYYHIVVADSRAPRDGKYIERIGMYNPNTNPASIEIDFDKALQWLQNGAQPSETLRAILSYKGILYKNHLLNGVKKGALTLELVEQKMSDWLMKKSDKIQSKKDSLLTKNSEEFKKKISAEAKVNEAKAQKIAKKYAKEVAAEKAANEETTEAQEQQPVTE